MSFIIKYHRAADKELAKLDIQLQLEIFDKIKELCLEPRPYGYKKLNKYHSERSPNKTCYRIKHKQYRVIYTIEDQLVTITVVKITHRKDAY